MRGRGVIALLFLAFLVAMGCVQEISWPDDAAKPAEASPFVRSAAVGVSDEKVEVAEEADVTGTPKIEFAATDFNFGEVEAGTKIEHVFAFKNTGDDLLKIEKVRSS